MYLWRLIQSLLCIERRLCVSVDLWEPHHWSLLQWDASSPCVHVSIESDRWKESCRSNAWPWVSHRAGTLSVSLHSHSRSRPGAVPRVPKETLKNPSASSSRGLLWPNLAELRFSVKTDRFPEVSQSTLFSGVECTLLNEESIGSVWSWEECLKCVNRGRGAPLNDWEVL